MSFLHELYQNVRSARKRYGPYTKLSKWAIPIFIVGLFLRFGSDSSIQQMIGLLYIRNDLILGLFASVFSSVTFSHQSLLLTGSQTKDSLLINT